MDLTNFIINNSIKINVKTNTKKTVITKLDSDTNTLHVDVCQKPENNKANIEIEKFLSKLTNKTAKIVRGLKSKHKLVKLS